MDVSSSTTKTIESPNFPNAYPLGKTCIWLIRVRIIIVKSAHEVTSIKRSTVLKGHFYLVLS